MRLFATGAMNWVMSRALPEDVPIEAKMVTKAIERAQNTVEARNAEIRKDVLKYDEVNHEQRKVIYARRMQIIDQAELRDETLDLLEAALQGVVDGHCPTDHPEDWDLEGLLADASGYYPTQFSLEELQAAASPEQIMESMFAEAVTYYEEREVAMPNGAETMRQVEREIMLQIIDQKWREHLSEMDYLREGINLRAMGQQDPLVAWQTEGYEMFGAMMAGVDDDYVRYVMRAQVQVLEEAEEAATLSAHELDRATYIAPDDPVSGMASMRQAAAAMPEPLAPTGVATNGASANGDGEPQTLADLPTMVPIVKSEREKLGRNDPCWCGSGKKFKLCHGR
jgi:preprotein translocase subunit SecA